MKFSKSSILLIISVLTMTIGCSDQKIDPFLVGDAKCSPPCWMSITPGFTTKSEADNIVLNLEGRQNYSSSENDVYARYKGKSIHIYSNSTNQMVDGIDLDLDGTRLEPLIDEFGEPKYFSITIDQGCTFTIYYPDKGLHFLGNVKSTPMKLVGWFLQIR